MYQVWIGGGRRSPVRYKLNTFEFTIQIYTKIYKLFIFKLVFFVFFNRNCIDFYIKFHAKEVGIRLV